MCLATYYFLKRDGLEDQQNVSAKAAVERAMSSLLQRQGLNREQAATHLQVLEDYECWNPLFRYMDLLLKDPNQRQASDYIKLAQIQSLSLDDAKQAAATCAKLVRDLEVGFTDFRAEIIPILAPNDDFEREALICEAILPLLKQRDDTVACLERLCLIYEKKKYDEERLNQCYEKLISIDPRNVKALRYFKVVHTQNQDWSKVVRVLKALYESLEHVNDRFRIAQELATVYLYQLDAAQAAIEVLDRYCAGSPLDTTTIHYEAYYRLRDWQGCHRVLTKYLAKLTDHQDQAIVFFKLGELEELLDLPEKALNSYRESSRLAPSFLEPVERLIEIYVSRKDWSSILATLQSMQDILKRDALKDRIQEAVDRIHDALKKKR